jgi:hypothetical protein
MLIKNLFERDISRAINGVVKADQLDDSSVWQELDEFVMTKELDLHFRKFIGWFLESVEGRPENNSSGKMGVWIAGFFGSGKSHFLKIISYLLRNRTHSFNGQSKQAVDFFEDKVKDAMLFADIKKAVSKETDVILFNIDAKASHGSGIGRDLILHVFLKVLNELQGYCGEYPHVADMERHLDSQGKLNLFHEEYQNKTGKNWVLERDAFQFSRDEVIASFSYATGQSLQAAEKWFEQSESQFSVSPEKFCKWVKEYLDSKGPKHRLVFLVDEVGQFIGTDSHLMLSLQSITEELGTVCNRRAWLIVTSQEDMDSVLGDMGRTKKQDFSKIQGRFFTPLSLSSSNADEVIQARLLAKNPVASRELRPTFDKRGDILNNQLSFTNAGMTFRKFLDTDDFVKNYPFAPYQFQLVQKIFEAIRKAGATGTHLSRGERSMLDAFQSAAQASATKEIGILVPLYDFYPSIEGFVDTTVKLTIDQASSNPSLEPFDALLLRVLFLIRYVDQMKSTVDNLVILCLNQIDGDRLSLRRQIEASLARLESQTLINRNGDIYSFLTNEERDINKEIKQVDIAGGEESKLLAEIIFEDLLKSQKKHRFSSNRMDFEFNRKCDNFPIGNQKDGSLLVSIITPLSPDYEQHPNQVCLQRSNDEGGHVLIRIGNDESLGREIRTFLQTAKYCTRRNDGTASETIKRILNDNVEANRLLRARLSIQLSDMLVSAEYFVCGQQRKIRGTEPSEMLADCLEYLIKNTFNKMNFLDSLHENPLQIAQTILRGNNLEQEAQQAQVPINSRALEDLRSHLLLSGSHNQRVILEDLLGRREIRPYGWPEDQVILLLARLYVFVLLIHV